MYKRTLAHVIREVSESFPVLFLTGPRQVGKTTLLEMCAEDNRNYVTLDDLDARNLAITDPGLFLQTYTPPLIIDEAQYAPQLFSYIKISVDKKKINGAFWLTGSQKFLLMKNITESLAGRVAVLDLLGFSQGELERKPALVKPFFPSKNWLEHAEQNSVHKQLHDTYKRIWLGSFPRVTDNQNIRDIFFRSYVQTYIQRDVKDILSITDDNTFYKFLGAVAARTSQLLNYADLAKDVGVDNKTVKAWLSVLETSGLVYLLYPYHTNVTKRLIKTPKLYFLDTGLCCYLTKWIDPVVLEAGAMSGAILESYLFSEILKSYYHNGLTPPFYFYRDQDQKEIDLVIDAGDTLHPVEFKKTGTPSLTAAKHFPVLAKLNKKVGHGAVLCFIEKKVPLSPDVTAIPISYLF